MAGRGASGEAGTDRRCWKGSRPKGRLQKRRRQRTGGESRKGAAPSRRWRRNPRFRPKPPSAPHLLPPNARQSVPLVAKALF
jgi:hypothetical protein